MTESERAVYKKKYPMHNLTPMDTEGVVRLYVEHDQRYFSYKDYGSRIAAIHAAKIARDKYPADKIHSIYDYDKGPTRGAVPTRGICYYRQMMEGPRGERGQRTKIQGDIIGYVAQWQVGPADDRRTKTKIFRFDQYPDALQASEEYRQRMVIENSLLISDQ